MNTPQDDAKSEINKDDLDDWILANDESSHLPKEQPQAESITVQIVEDTSQTSSDTLHTLDTKLDTKVETKFQTQQPYTNTILRHDRWCAAQVMHGLCQYSNHCKFKHPSNPSEYRMACDHLHSLMQHHPFCQDKLCFNLVPCRSSKFCKPCRKIHI